MDGIPKLLTIAGALFTAFWYWTKISCYILSLLCTCYATDYKHLPGKMLEDLFHCRIVPTDQVAESSPVDNNPSPALPVALTDKTKIHEPKTSKKTIHGPTAVARPKALADNRRQNSLQTPPQQTKPFIPSVTVIVSQVNPDMMIPKVQVWPQELAELTAPRPIQQPQAAPRPVTPTAIPPDLKQYLQNTSLPKDPAGGLSPSQQHEAFMYLKNGLPLFKQAVLDYKRYAGATSAYATSTAGESARSIQQFMAVYDAHAPYLNGYASDNDLIRKYAPYIDLGRHIINGK